MKSNAWVVQLPKYYSLLGPFRFENPVSERELRIWFRNWMKVDRLPRGTEVWPITMKSPTKTGFLISSQVETASESIMDVKYKPHIRSVGTIHISYQEALRHKSAVREIVKQLRESNARDKELPAREMRWEYSTCKQCGPGIGPDEGWMTSLIGRAWHWWAAKCIEGQDV